MSGAVGSLGRLRVTTLLGRLPTSWNAPSPDSGPGPGASPDPPSTADEQLESGLDRAARSGHAARDVDLLARTLERLPTAARTQVLDPVRRWSGGGTSGTRTVRLGDAVARQVDGTTCGSAVLGMLAAAGDPVLALWLVRGQVIGDGVDGLGARVPDGGPGSGAAARFRHLQRVLKRRTGRGALGPLPWPATLGTPPWGAAGAARYADRRYTHRVVEGSRGRAVVATALAAAAAGTPVPLFTGGDLATGISSAVPRHVVLLTTAGGGTCQVYEPSSGSVHRIDTARFQDGAGEPGVRRALGGWPHVVWAVLPAGRAGLRAGGGTSTARR
ncbi:hypothetical protein [Cellulosimicrobium arenosum]|uniref:Uncharacterized protein n=1 Tax=Cellulosimicrobium arenosum TaxID=2708133 RepID=A0A927G734_9MICO|nr:hypothetical protein [Cellulosimicrobium arenosum]MBD8078089.1 hypothetical protein [Cellulosimicrobium arenosum]